MTTATTTTTHVESTWLTVDEMAARLRVHVITLRKMAREGLVPHLRIGSALRFDPEAVVAALGHRR